MLQGSLVKTITTDGLELKGFWVDNKSEVAVFHSHGTSGDFYTHEFVELEGNKLSAKGISFLTANNRGHDVYADIRKHVNGKVEWYSGGGGFEKFEDCLLDIDSWIDFLAGQGVKKIILQAHSLTQKILYYQALKKNPKVIGQIHLSPCNDSGYVYYQVGEKRFNEINEQVKKMIDEGEGRELLPKELYVVCPMSALAYFGYLTEEGAGNLFPYHKKASPKWKILSQTADPLLAIYGGADVFIKPSVDEAARLFQEKAKKATVKIIKDASHSYLGFEKELVDSIVNWIAKL